MTTTTRSASWRDTETPLAHPWDLVLGTTSLVRALRVLIATREPMPVREVARRARLYLRGVQIAVDRLERAGFVEYVGTGGRPQVRIVADHPLLPALEQLFAAERARLDRLEDAIRSALKPLAPKLDSAWIEVPEPGGATSGACLTIGLLTPSANASELADAVRGAVTPVARREDVALEVVSWTRPDLANMTAPQRAAMLDGWPLVGTPPAAFLSEEAAPRGPRRRTTHADRDREIQERMKELGALLRRRPELLRAARAEVGERMRSAPAPEARTWREWHDILSAQRPRRLAEWLVSDRGDAVRLRQSLPAAFTRALREQDEARSRSRPSANDA
jgi:hypothetical protein